MFGTTQDSAAEKPAAFTTAAGRRAGRFARPRILIVGCGDVGMRLVDRLGDRFRIHALTHSPERAASLRAAGALPIVADLDARHTLDRVGGLARTVVHLAPPKSHGRTDLRTQALCAALHGVERLVYVSTSGVYGDCAGAWVSETRPVAPQTDRAWRRVDAERQLREWAIRTGARLVILRVPGIYAADRLPLARIVAGTPVLHPADDVYTNHIHADDLARLLAVALDRGLPQRVVHAVDGSALRMAEWFDLVAAAHDLPAPPRVSRVEIAQRVAPDRLSFMSESRRLSDRRMHDDLGMRLTYPTVREGLAGAKR